MNRWIFCEAEELTFKKESFHLNTTKARLVTERSLWKRRRYRLLRHPQHAAPVFLQGAPSCLSGILFCECISYPTFYSLLLWSCSTVVPKFTAAFTTNLLQVSKFSIRVWNFKSEVCFEVWNLDTKSMYFQSCKLQLAQFLWERRVASNFFMNAPFSKEICQGGLPAMQKKVMTRLVFIYVLW